MNQELTLAALSPGESCRVLAMRTAGPMRRRLRELGLVEGAELCCLGRSPLGDPAAYCLHGAVLALRDREAGGVLIERGEAENG